jgi:hypothetical protein
VIRRCVEEQGAHGVSSLCWWLRLPGGRGRVRVVVVVATFLFSVYQMAPRTGRNAGQVLSRPYGIIFKGLLVGMALAGAVIVMDSLNLL